MLFITPSTLRIFFVYGFKWLIFERMWLFFPPFLTAFCQIPRQKIQTEFKWMWLRHGKMFWDRKRSADTCSFVLTFYFATSICFKFWKIVPCYANQIESLVVHFKTLLVRFLNYILKNWTCFIKNLFTLIHLYIVG